MKMKSLIVALLAATIGSAFAGDVYVVGALGRSTIDQKKSDIDNDLTAAGVTGLSSSLKDHDTGYKLQLGYQISPNLAIEGGYVDLGKTSYKATFTGGNGTASAKADGWNIAALGILPLSNDFSLFGKLGFIDAKVEVKANASGPGGAASGTGSATRWKPNYGIGANYQFSKTVGIRVEYEQFNKLGNKNDTGESNVNLFSVGVAYKF